MFKYIAIVALVVGYTAGNASALQCFTCTTFNNTNCLVPDRRNELLECPPSPNVNEVTCFTRIVGQDVERGCATELTQTERDNCALVNNCQLCANVNNETCNGNLFPHGRLHCHQCEGNTNSTCADEIQTEATPCMRFVVDDQCVVQVRDNSVVRGCLSENDACRNSRDCHVCAGNGCNFRHFEHSAAGSVVAQLPLLIAAILLTAFVTNK
ncbi:uncharacterized protein LOC128710239 [Anopheles marshallii]|uniref:uncharacterized protein LOC128710239 n=1 Tax=Anopheles marshallii TaxID=1521116 RepID=UPI00237C2125|nr:uncharacterized protein LOC128710239 [Anopheles marshallii]